MELLTIPLRKLPLVLHYLSCKQTHPGSMTPHDFDVQPIKLALCTVLAYVLDYVCYSCRLTDCDEHLIFYYLTVQEKYTCGKSYILIIHCSLCISFGGKYVLTQLDLSSISRVPNLKLYSFVWSWAHGLCATQLKGVSNGNSFGLFGRLRCQCHGANAAGPWSIA